MHNMGTELYKIMVIYGISKVNCDQTMQYKIIWSFRSLWVALSSLRQCFYVAIFDHSSFIAKIDITF